MKIKQVPSKTFRNTSLTFPCREVYVNGSTAAALIVNAERHFEAQTCAIMETVIQMYTGRYLSTLGYEFSLDLSKQDT